MLLKKSDLKPKVLVFVGLITAILTIYAEGYFNNGYGMLITMISLGLYVFALIRQSLVLSKSAYFMWIIFVFIRFVAYIFQYGQPFANINKMVGVIITAVLLWLGIRGLIMFETSLVRYQKKTLITDESSNDSTG
jgi:magnesium-transporting ATPase (P-type)